MSNSINVIFILKGDTCQWRILATHGEKIILNVTQLDIPTSSGRHTDFLEIRDGYWHKSELLGTHLRNTTSSFLIIIPVKDLFMMHINSL